MVYAPRSSGFYGRIIKGDGVFKGGTGGSASQPAANPSVYGTARLGHMSPGLTPRNNPAWGGYASQQAIAAGGAANIQQPEATPNAGGPNFAPNMAVSGGFRPGDERPYWTPNEFNRPATPYPGEATPGQRPPTRRPSFGGNVGLAQRAANPQSFTLDQWGYGQAGNYMPGHHIESNRHQQQAANAFYANQGFNSPIAQRWMSGQGNAGGGSFQGEYDAAKAENEARYRDVLGGYQDRYQRNMDALRGMGAQEGRDINDQFNKRQSATRSDLVGRGLGNSSLLATTAAGNDRERTDALGRLDERLRQQQVSNDAQLSGDVLQTMASRVDSYPDLNRMAQLFQGAGAAGMGAGGGGPQYVSPQQMGFQIPGQMTQMMGGGYLPRMQAQQGGYQPKTLAEYKEMMAMNQQGGGLTPSQMTQALRRQAEVDRRGNGKLLQQSQQMLNNAAPVWPGTGLDEPLVMRPPADSGYSGPFTVGGSPGFDDSTYYYGR